MIRTQIIIWGEDFGAYTFSKKVVELSGVSGIRRHYID